jgi:hypothetical protein
LGTPEGPNNINRNTNVKMMAINVIVLLESMNPIQKSCNFLAYTLDIKNKIVKTRRAKKFKLNVLLNCISDAMSANASSTEDALKNIHANPTKSVVLQYARHNDWGFYPHKSVIYI